MLYRDFYLSASESAEQSTASVLALAIGAVVVIFAVMILSAFVWSKHGLMPTEHWTAVMVPEFVKRRMRSANRSAGWGDGVEVDEAEQSVDRPSIEKSGP